jgi:3-hydroxy-D-aspartate aldolase
MKIDELDTPVLLVDGDAFDRNMKRMQKIAGDAGIAYRPHAKAHKSPEIAEVQIEHGAVGICCAKLGEAEVMVAAGIKDILITTPVVGLSKLMRLMQIAGQAQVAVVVDNEANIAEMAMCAHSSGVRCGVIIEIDVGQHRCGVQPGAPALALAQAIRGQEWLEFRGLQGYQGLIQMTASFDERKAAADAALKLLTDSAALIRDAGMQVPVLTGGGSGTSIIDAASGGLTELQPGGYLFMDSRYQAVDWDDGSKIPFEQSLSLLTSVISRPAPDRAILDMGLKAVSSDGGPPVPVDLPGASFRFGGEEHGELVWENGTCPLSLGQKVKFWPSHCDTTVNLYERFIVTSGDDVTGVWDIAARGRVQ